MADFWYQPVGKSTASGASVTTDSAMRLSAMWACVNLISGTTASLPLFLYREQGAGKVKDTEHPLNLVLRRRPNTRQTPMQYRRYRKVCELLTGNSFGFKVLGRDGEIEQTIPLNPAAVTPEPVQAESYHGMPLYVMRYRVRMRDGTEQIYLDDEIDHGIGLSLDGYVGVSVVEYARQGLGLATVQEEHGARFFGNGARPGGILSPKAPLSDDALKRFKGGWNDTFQGVGNSSKVAVLPVDVSYTALGVSNEDSQFLESREFQIEEVARWYGVPLHMIASTAKSTSWGSGLENQVQSFITFTLRSWLVGDEQAIKRDYITEEDMFAEFSLDGLLRADTATRAAALQTARQNGIINAEFWARLENWPVPEGEAGQAYWRPANMVDANAPPPPMAPEPTMPDEPQMEPPGHGPSKGDARYVRLLTAAAERVVRREMSAIARFATREADAPEEWRRGVEEFYADYDAYVMVALQVQRATAERYTFGHRAALIAHGVGVMDDWMTVGVQSLVTLAIEEVV